MTEIRCPMCGKNNPAEETICQFCHAVLRPPDQSPFEPSSPSAEDKDIPDWLRELRAFGGEGVIENAQSPAGAAEESRDDAGDEPEPDKSATEDWLARLQAASTSEWPPASQEEEAGEKTAQSEHPGASPATPDFSSQDLAGWLRGLDETESGEGKTPAPPAEETSEPASPDWLSGLAAAEPSSPETPPAASPELPDWMAAESSAPPPSQPAGEDEAALPDWLSGLAAAEPSSPETPTAASPEPPDWLSAESSAPPPPQPAGEDETTDWIDSFLAGEVGPAAQTPSFTGEGTSGWPGSEEAPTETGEEEAIEPAPAGAEELPGWLKELQSLEPPVPTGAAAVPAFAPDEETPPPPAGPPAKPFTGDDFSEWLSLTGEEESKEAATEKEPDEALPSTELPGWLQAMRPVEAVVPASPDASEDDVLIEKSGPLSGLRGTLPADDLVTQYSKPPLYSARLRLTEKQRSHARLLEAILAEEGRPTAARQEGRQASGRLLRLLVGLVVLAVVLLPLLVTPPGVAAPAAFAPAELRSFYQRVESLPPGAAVLLAVEYDPAFAGELRRAAGGVVEHLMRKQVRLVSISTVAAGPLLAEDLLQSSLRGLAAQGQQPPGYRLDEQAVNLGYLAGGAASLQEFARYPQHAAAYGLLSALELHHSWGHNALAGINSLDDFALVIVLAGDLDAGRAWIEQVGPVLSRTPLLAATSAQAAPLFLPYVHSGQLEGLISGLAGGGAYARLAQTTPPAAGQVNAYRAGLAAAVFLILLGALIQGVRMLFTSRREQAEGQS